MYIDRGPEYGDDDVRPGDDTERYLEYWNLVFMAIELHEDGSLTDLPNRNIDTGPRTRADGADPAGSAESVFETDGFRPLVELAEELSGRGYADDAKTTRAMRILADHSRGMVNLIADGVVPSNEDRGYVLRRIMRRAILQGAGPGTRGALPRPLRRARDRAHRRRRAAARRGARERAAAGSPTRSAASAARSTAARSSWRG